MEIENKKSIVEASNINWEKLWKLIDSMTDIEQKTPFDFSKNNKKEEHWKRDKNLRDVLVHLSKWHELNINWVKNTELGVSKPFLREGYTWNNYGLMNLEFLNEAQCVSLEEAKFHLRETHNKIMRIIKEMPEEKIFTKQYNAWEGTTDFASYFIANTSAHYEWAIEKIELHIQNLKISD